MSYAHQFAPRAALAIVASLLVITVACSDDRQPTSPTSANPHGRSAADVREPSTDGVKLSQVRPTDQVGFTKITLVVSDPYDVPVGTSKQGFALCPVGTTVTGGGFDAGTFNVAKPYVSHSRVVTVGVQNGWSVSVENKAAGAGAFDFQVTALCAS